MDPSASGPMHLPLPLSSARGCRPVCPHLPLKLPESPVTKSWTKKKGWNTVDWEGEQGRKKLALSKEERNTSGGGLEVRAKSGGAVAGGDKWGKANGQDRRAERLGEGVEHTVTKEEAGHLGVLIHTVQIVLVYLRGMLNRVGDIEGQALARGTADEYWYHQETLGRKKTS